MGCAGSRSKYSNEITEFLVVLREDDYKKCPGGKSYYEKLIKKGKKDIPGILHTIDFEDVNLKDSDGNLVYKIIGKVVPHTVYIMLPKEREYVKADAWEFEHMKSQINEIVAMFGLLGARSVAYDSSDNVGSHVDVAASMSIPLPHMVDGVELGAKCSKGESTATQFTGLIEFSQPVEINPTRKTLEDSDNMYYLGNNHGLRSVARRRIVNKVEKDHFSYSYRRDDEFGVGLTAKFSKVGVDCQFNSTSLMNFSMKFEVEYFVVDDM